MTRHCVTCGDASGDAKLCAFCERFGVSRSAAPNPVIRRRVMRALDTASDLAMQWADAADRARAEARWWRKCTAAMAIVALAAVFFGVMMLNALPSAQGAVRSDAQAARVMAAWCPSQRAMTRRVCVRWLRVAQCETGDPADRGVTAESLRRIQWRYNGASGFDGGLQFSVRTWRGNVGRVASWRLTWLQRRARERGEYVFAYAAPPAVQMLAAEALRVRPGGGLGHWPRCGARW